MLSIQEIRDNCMSSVYTRGRDLFMQGKYRNVEIYEDDIYENQMDISAVIKGSGSKWYNTRVELHAEFDTILDYECECPAYESYYGLCKHCVATALIYRARQMKENASDMQKASGGKIQKGMVFDRETSDSLKKMIETYAIRDRSHLFGGYYKAVNLQPEIRKEYRGYEIEFKIGAKKMYVLKNIPKLLENVMNCQYVSYGKNFAFQHDRSAFTEEALGWIDRMTDILRTATGSDDFGMYTYSSDYRYISLKSYGIERILNDFVGKNLEIDGKNYEIIDENPELTLKIRPQLERGAYLSMEETEYIRGVNYVFAVINDKIFRCSPQWKDAVWILIETLGAGKSNDRYSANKELFLNKKDFEAFCGNVLPRISTFLKIENTGVDFEPYMPKEPEFSAYLSLDEKDDRTILARAEAAYGSSVYDLMAPLDLGSDYRDLEKESSYVQVFHKYFISEETSLSVRNYCSTDEDVYRLVSEGMEELRSRGNVFLDEKLRGIKVMKAPQVTVGVSLEGNLLEMDIKVPQMDMGEVYEILSAYRRRKKYFRLKNGDFIQVEDNGLAVLSELTQGLSISPKELESGKVELPMYRTNYIDAVLKNKSEDLEIKRNSSFKQLIRNMRDFSDSDFDIPEGVHAKLRTYQKEGFRWLCTLAQWGFGGILADDMGLGKTLQMLTFLWAMRKKALIVCPASLVYNWASEANRFVPECKVAVISGNSTERQKEIEDSRNADVTITSYDLLKRDISHYEDRRFDYMVVDEAQYIKNAGTQAAKAVKLIRAGVRFAMTGTPIENRLSDLWSIFDYIMPGYLYDYSQFKEEIEMPMVQSDDEVAAKRLKMMINPFILRRKKQDVLKDLPDKLEEVVYTQMGEEQKKLYLAQVNKLRMELSGASEEEFRKDNIKYLAELTRLRQLCCSPELVYENYRGQSAKLDTCMEVLQNAIDGGHKVLLFSQFTQMLDLIQKALEKKKISYLYLSGKNSKLQRQQMVETFQKSDVQVFLISLKAGGVGLNLTEADIVIHYDPWWNVAAQNQATDRAHRIGQKHVVSVMKLVAKDTIEEKIIDLQERKAKLAESVIEGEGVAEHRLSRMEILGLLEGR